MSFGNCSGKAERSGEGGNSGEKSLSGYSAGRDLFRYLSFTLIVLVSFPMDVPVFLPTYLLVST